MGHVPIDVRHVSGYEELEQWVALRNKAMPDDPENAQMMALIRATELDHVDLLASIDGELVGTAMLAGDPHSAGSSHPFAEIVVLPEHRGRGVGATLFTHLSSHARRLGKEGFVGEARAGDSAALAFLERRGYVEDVRTEQYALDLAAVPDAEPPGGIEIAWLADRADLVPGMHEVARSSYPGLSYRSGRAAQTLQDWQMYELGEPALRLELTAIALAEGEVVGYSPMVDLPAIEAVRQRLIVRPGERLGEIAVALTCAQARRGRELGLAKIISWRRNEANATIQEALGFVLRAVSIGFRGPLEAERASS
jgi:GNAT superfamily N-acetyltransferase